MRTVEMPLETTTNNESLWMDLFMSRRGTQCVRLSLLLIIKLLYDEYGALYGDVASDSVTHI